MTLPDPMIGSDPDRLAGTPCFAGTRVPVETLFTYLENGDTLEQFLANFPSVSRHHAIAVLRASQVALIQGARERETYAASADELAAIDEARAQIARGEHAADEDVKAAFARFRSSRSSTRKGRSPTFTRSPTI